ncbi:Hsp70 family protein, partial [Tistrella mobilis]
MSRHILAIDLGTTYSSMATLDPVGGRAVVLRNAEDEEKTPSVVYFGADGTMVGTPAEHMLEDEEESRAVFMAPKRYLSDSDFLLALPDGRMVTAVDAVTAILTKLREDAEALHFGGPVGPVVLTCPASFGPSARDALREAAARAGLGDVRLVDEPVAAALAGLRDSQGQLGQSVLAYDLGGGTFDAAVLRRDGNGYRLAAEPGGLEWCGGNDFDRAIYDWFDTAALSECGQSFDRAAGGIDLSLLRACRRAKETLSARPTVLLRGLLAGQQYKQSLDQMVLEELIGRRIEQTVGLSVDLVQTARRRGHAVDSVLLVGGSSRIP